jgi:maltose-binding protein MalE
MEFKMNLKMKKSVLTSVFATVLLLIVSCNGNSQTEKATTKTTVKGTIEVIQFHSEHRCMTCNKIEKITRETLKSYPAIPFSLVNVDDAKNEKKVEQFEATGTALFLYNPKTGKKKDLTDMAFMNVGDETKFKKELKKEIDLFLKS